jgi:hypothetical protein
MSSPPGDFEMQNPESSEMSFSASLALLWTHMQFDGLAGPVAKSFV